MLYAVPALLVVSGWLRLESDHSSRGSAVWLVLLALAPALVQPLWGRVLAAVAVSLLALDTALHVSLLDARPFDGTHDFFGPLLSGFGEGVLDFYDVRVPFPPAQQPFMHGVVLLAIFGFCLAIALAIGTRRPLAAGLALLAGASWPATLSPGGGLQRGAFILAAVLMLLAWAGPRRPHTLRPAVLAGVVLVLAALVATTSPAVAKGEFLSWKSWDPYDQPDDPVGVRYVWDANYTGIAFPKKVTTVLRVKGPERAYYWRATTLDTFATDRWLEDLPLLVYSSRPIELTADPLLPPAARDRERWIQADVTIEALRDRRLPGPSMPVRYDPRGMGRVEYGPGGVAVLRTGLERDHTYSVWAYAPRPTPAQLATSRFAGRLRGTVISRYLEIAPGAAMLPFGSPGRDLQLQNLLGNAFYGPTLAPYEPLFRQAQEVVGQAPRNPYSAVVTLEAWFRAQGGFTYDEQPPTQLSSPPLVAFVTETRRGYCQQFAGAMALMLRYLGIPARVAAGFTSGAFEKKDREWTVTDHDAHAWVEVWFDGWGWLPFDPTPGRGRLSGSYTSASASFNAEQAQRVAGGATAGGQSPGILGEFVRSRLQGTEIGGRDIPGDVGGTGSRAAAGASLLKLLALIAALLVAVIVSLKVAIRRARHLTRDPRRVAAACRRELVDYLADQRVEISPSATLGELADTVASRLYVDADAFVAAVGAARFAPPREARTAAREARHELRLLRRRLRRRLNAGERARGLVSVRSLGFNG
ncbi:MAG: transglutaminaseTgpA domain-containing protein [Gaiellaceae bacterium]